VSGGNAFAMARVSAVRLAMVPSEVMFPRAILGFWICFPVELGDVVIDEMVDPARNSVPQRSMPWRSRSSLVLVEAHCDHLEKNHEVGNCAGHVANVIGVGHLHRMFDYVVFDLVEYVFYELGMRGISMLQKILARSSMDMEEWMPPFSLKKSWIMSRR
jgi:hypothetical protein